METKHTISRMTITPAENGGASIEHQFKNEPRVMKGAIRGGFDHGYVEPEMHSFGPKDAKKMMEHISKHLGMKMDPADKEEREAGD